MKTDALAVSILAYVSLTAVASADPAMLLTDKGGDRVLEYDIATGMFVGVSASEDEHTGFDTPVSIEFLDGYVYVSATTSDVVGRYRLDDPFEAEVLVDKPTDGLGNPMGLTAGPDGRIYVADEGSFPSDPPPVLITKILAIDPATGDVEVYTSYPGTDQPTSRDGLTKARDVLFGPDGHLYVLNRNQLGTGNPGNNVLRFTGPLDPTPGMPLPLPGESGALYALLGNDGPTAFILGPDQDSDGFEDFYISSNRALDKIDIVSGPGGANAGTHLGTFLQTPIAFPWGVGFSGDEFFVTSFEDDEVWVYDLDGVFDRVFAPTGAEPPDAHSGLLLDNPTDLIFLPEPGGVPALVSGALVLACLRRRRTRSEAHPGRGRAH